MSRDQTTGNKAASSPKGLSIGIVSDEIVLDIRDAVSLGMSWGISLYEIRSAPSGRIPFFSPRDIAAVMHARSELGIAITALSPGIFKHPLSRTTEIEHELTVVLPNTIEAAHQFGAPLVIVFGFQRENNEPRENIHRAVEVLSRAALLARRAGIILAVENEPGCWCDSGSATAHIIHEVSSPALRANWDPCNAFGTEEFPVPDGYEAIKNVVANVHVKDTRKGALVECLPVGEGVIDWKGQLAALIRDGHISHVTIETHSLPLVEKSKRNVDTVRAYLNEIYCEEKIGI
ncbi:MAG: sugar phosphate isomerase/epimerase [Bacteroidota bacterium]|nr:sugar phosphate isomerase/epimerase [Bacteroidota bacterium]